MKKGFTLLELIVVIIIIGVLASIGFSQYTKMVEKGRTAEAKTVLGQLRSAEVAYYQEYGVYTATLSNLATDAPSATCVATNYFTYAADATTTATATRCTGTNGKTPGAASVYSVTLNYDGTFGGTAGYY